MANKRKYPEVQGWWVYSIKIPSINKYYIGVSGRKECSQRWNKSSYKGMALEPYLNEWDSMEKTVLVDNLTKEQSYQYEDNIIRALKMNDLCINTNRSGLITDDINAYHKQHYENDTEFREREKERSKQWYENNKEKILEQQRQYKKQRYQNDAEYRERQKQRIKQYRLKKKLEKFK